jgi:hypothetical protein
MPFMPADTGMEAQWSPRATLDLIHGEIEGPGFAAIAPAGLVGAARQYQRVNRTTTDKARNHRRTGESLLERVDEIIRLIRDLDDRHGGRQYLRYAEAQLEALALLARQVGTMGPIGVRLVEALAEMAHQAGWMAYDAADSGILADLSYQTATEGHVDEGASIGQAALDAAERSPASVRGSVMIRVSHAYAAAGRFREFERSWGEALDQTGKRDPERDPTWMYYFSVEHVRAQAGCALVQRGRWEVAEGNKGDGWRFLQRGESLLRGGAHHRPLGHANQRRALFEGAQLALACSSQGNYQDACDAIREALQRLQTVHSPRSVGVLQALAYDFRRRPRERHIRDVLPVLRASLAQHAIAHRDDAG